ncbi:hypothetical protein RHMOL_Rhmol07G0230100 [Rhododendron molle]|uniref:Uncharacterized protein n=1 Tax=Rhododendron molle TaxID=49168 RepID=A0ACC0N3Q9_RHOML|nr:hypothetical protein RHMOL_Rhmol07G0230100 [Rhododendron molle]
MGNWIEETFEVLWNWFMKTMMQSIAIVDVLLAIFPLILFVASRILSAVNSQYLKHLEEEEIKTLQKQIEERDKQIHELIVKKQTLVQQTEELKREFKARKEENEALKKEFKARKGENAQLKSKLPAHVLEKLAFSSELREVNRKNT